jgi:hypothetical protein
MHIWRQARDPENAPVYYSKRLGKDCQFLAGYYKYVLFFRNRTPVWEGKGRDITVLSGNSSYHQSPLKSYEWVLANDYKKKPEAGAF